MLNHWQDRPKNVFPILADIENLPFENIENFDLIFSSFALQWIDNFENLFNNLQKILKKNGYLIFCIPTKKSLKEIQNASKKSGCNFFFRDLPSSDIINKSLANTGFKEQFSFYQIVTKYHQNAVFALKEIKNIGANYSETCYKKAVEKKSLKKFNEIFIQDSHNRISWHLYYLIYQK